MSAYKVEGDVMEGWIVSTYDERTDDFSEIGHLDGAGHTAAEALKKCESIFHLVRSYANKH
jgi:hypothetical protein